MLWIFILPFLSLAHYSSNQNRVGSNPNDASFFLYANDECTVRLTFPFFYNQCSSLDDGWIRPICNSNGTTTLNYFDSKNNCEQSSALLSYRSNKSKQCSKLKDTTGEGFYYVRGECSYGSGPTTKTVAVVTTTSSRRPSSSTKTTSVEITTGLITPVKCPQPTTTTTTSACLRGFYFTELIYLIVFNLWLV
ncbi:hypothetical protein BC833DRAFT_78172 [Globomyces pollinis-pini]|nr:hypothetical protein BC833DRAFT_78172 [Globomyces pollinis-pini]